MSFREKSAWIMVAALLLAGANYLMDLGKASVAIGHIAPPRADLVLAYIISLTFIAVFGQIVIALLSPKEAEAGADERDRLIAAKAGSASGVSLAVTLVCLLGAYVFGPHARDPFNGDMLFQGALIGLMVAQIAEYATQIWHYRRGV